MKFIKDCMKNILMCLCLLVVPFVAYGDGPRGNGNRGGGRHGSNYQNHNNNHRGYHGGGGHYYRNYDNYDIPAYIGSLGNLIGGIFGGGGVFNGPTNYYQPVAPCYGYADCQELFRERELLQFCLRCTAGPVKHYCPGCGAIYDPF